ncbi:dephospho-CoA kinase [Sporolactobacillus sp. THM7-4]|nr:dephospho-CoA kinase [Sporolactobacillus sp. THM7-4]
MLKIGLTGGIASGKSTVSHWLKNHHYPLIDADQVSRDVVAPGEKVLSDIADAFGKHMILKDGGLNRKALGELIFKDQDKRRKLNTILHPLIRKRIRERLDQLEKAGVTVVFLDIPLLFEGPLAHWVDRILVVYVSEDTQIRRLMARNGLTKEEALERITSQMPLDEKKKRADAVIDNNGSLEETEKQLIAILKDWNV